MKIFETIYREFGIEIPPEFFCENFPIENSAENHPCIPVDHPVNQPLPSGTLRWKKTQHHQSLENVEKLPKTQCPRNLISEFESDIFAGISYCKKPCQAIGSDQNQTSIVRLMLAVFSVTSAIITSFAIVIFLRDRKR